MRKYLVGAIALVALAFTSLGSAVGSQSAGGAGLSGAASPGTSTATSGCSRAKARQLVEQHHLNGFLLPNPVSQVLCGPFTGPGSQAMAVTILAPTCWGIQRWGVFRFASGTWRLVLDQPAYLVPPLVAVGSEIRETTAVFRSGDPRCIPSGGAHARIWHWNGSRLVAGPWKRVAKGEPEARGFDSPSLNISCGMFDDSSFRQVVCQSRTPPQKVTMDSVGRLSTCRDRTPSDSNNNCNLGDRGEGPIRPLAYGRQITVGRFRCLSLEIGVRCTVIRSGKGFLINRDGVSRVGP